jgi:hypothetical protein, TIGR02147
MKTTLPNLFEYNDFRRFINDYQKARHAQNRMFTKSEICKRLGIPNSRSYINDVINGRIVTSTFVNRFVKALELNAEQANFFRCLVDFNQSTVEDRERHFDQLVSLNRTPVKKIDKQTFIYYNEWYHGVVRALLAVYDFSDNYAVLARKLYPPITEKQAKDSISLLLELKLIKKNEAGFYKPTDKSITTGFFLSDELIKNYQVRCLQLAQNAIIQPHKKPQNITSRTISVSAEGYKRIEKRIQKFSSEIRSVIHKDEQAPDRVYHLDILLFPVSQ